MHPADSYDERDVDLRLGAAVTAIDPAAHEVGLAADGRVGYAKPLLTTGSAPRRLAVAGADLDGVLHLRIVGDSDRLPAAAAAAANGDRRRLDRAGARGGGPRRGRQGDRAGGRGTAAAAGARSRGSEGVRRAAPQSRGEPAVRSADQRGHRARRPGDGRGAGRGQRDWASRPTSGWPSRRARGWPMVFRSARPCARPSRTSTRQATWPTPSTRSGPAHSGQALGQCAAPAAGGDAGHAGPGGQL